MAGGSYEDHDEPHQPNVIDDHFYKVVALSAGMIIGLATVLFRWLEDWSWIDALYFSVVAVTTVGFGDLVPTTDGAKIVTVVYVLTGIGVITTFINMRLQRNERRRHSKREQK